MCLAYFNDAFSYLHYPSSLNRRTYTTINELPGDLVAQIILMLPPYPRGVLPISAACKN